MVDSQHNVYMHVVCVCVCVYICVCVQLCSSLRVHFAINFDSTVVHSRMDLLQIHTKLATLYMYLECLQCVCGVCMCG